jgi:hypothetical protein
VSEASTRPALLRNLVSLFHPIRQIPSSVWMAPLGGMSTSVSCIPLFELAETTRTSSVLHLSPKSIRPHIRLRTTTRCASICESKRTARRNNNRFDPCIVPRPSVYAQIPSRSDGMVTRGKPATLKRTMPGIVQHLSQCFPLPPREMAVLLKNADPFGAKFPSLSLAIRVHQWEPSSMQWTIIILRGWPGRSDTGGIASPDSHLPFDCALLNK